jgi:hypothetical protein
MGVVQAVKQVASDVVDTAKSAASASAKQIAKTPLDLLEEMLGQKPAGKTPEASDKPSEAGSSAQVNPEELKQKEQADQEYKTQRTEQLHKEIQARSHGYYENKKVEDERKKQATEQAEKQRKFQIEDLQKRKQEDFALKAAQDASSAEKRVGAG